MLYSDGLEKFNDALPEPIINAIEELKRLLGIDDEITIYKFDEFRIAIKVDININLPSKGTNNNIDIRSIEPILLVFSIESYPNRAPVVKSDRKDFPVDQLSHLYVVRNNIAPSLCLVRGNLDEWFANRRIQDLITVTRQWFAKAASGLLTEDGDEFDPVRLQGYYTYIIYGYTSMIEVILNKYEFIKDQNYALCLFSITRDKVYAPDSKSAYTYITHIPFSTSQQIKELVKTNIQKSDKDKNPKKFLFGLLFWSDKVFGDYKVNLPSNYGELEVFAKEHDIEIKEAITNYRNNDFDILVGIPVMIAIKRPKKLIGYDGEYELFHFIITCDTENVENGEIKKSAEVSNLSHREPFSSEMAKKISGHVVADSKILFLGAGSLGSKMIMHFARSGNTNLTIVDHDELSPHNLVRHELFMDSAGENKAKALVQKIKEFLIADNTETLIARPSKSFFLKQEAYKDNSWLIDTTASLNVQNWLSNGNFTNIQNRARAELAFLGRLGLLYIEGEGNNPRIDDLINYLYFLALEILILSEWLKEEEKKKDGEDYDIVDVGLGCNSATVLMGNDSIGFHASLMSKILFNENDRSTIHENGLINISVLPDNGYDIYSESILLKPLLVFSCCNGSGWEVRMLPIVMRKMEALAKKFGKVETGGVYIGIVNYKTKTVHVFDTIFAPKDSKHGKTYFYRGINNLPEQVEFIKQETGGMIGYVGEWHTHPMGLDQLSDIDLDAVAKLKPLNDSVPIPTFISVLSKNKYLPFIFE